MVRSQLRLEEEDVRAQHLQLVRLGKSRVGHLHGRRGRISPEVEDLEAALDLVITPLAAAVGLLLNNHKYNEYNRPPHYFFIAIPIGSSNGQPVVTLPCTAGDLMGLTLGHPVLLLLRPDNRGCVIILRLVGVRLVGPAAGAVGPGEFTVARWSSLFKLARGNFTFLCLLAPIEGFTATQILLAVIINHNY